jgi:hypothetical protein
VLELLKGLRISSREDGRVEVHGADPRVSISKALLANIADNPAPGVSLSGDVLRIDAANRTVIYRLGRETEDGLARLAEWPD